MIPAGEAKQIAGKLHVLSGPVELLQTHRVCSLPALASARLQNFANGSVTMGSPSQWWLGLQCIWALAAIRI